MKKLYTSLFTSLFLPLSMMSMQHSPATDYSILKQCKGHEEQILEYLNGCQEDYFNIKNEEGDLIATVDKNTNTVYLYDEDEKGHTVLFNQPIEQSRSRVQNKDSTATQQELNAEEEYRDMVERLNGGVHRVYYHDESLLHQNKKPCCWCCCLY